MGKEVENKDQPQLQPDGNQGQVKEKEANQGKDFVFLQNYKVKKGRPSPQAGSMVPRNLWILAGQSQKTNPGRHGKDQPVTWIYSRSINFQRTSSLWIQC
uniref:Uncharacterized protein n=1 Tax=Romanomermis culicivorax TaxID=13658 RepID=A0A915JMT2_ROMCU